MWACSTITLALTRCQRGYNLRRVVSVKNSAFRSLCLLAFVALLTAICSSKTNFSKHHKGKPYQDIRYQGGAQKIPGRVECAYYDLGGEGVAYHDLDARNNGSGVVNPVDGTYLNQFRMEEGVDISYTKFHDQIDSSPYNIVQPPEKSALCRMDRTRGVVQYHSSSGSRWSVQRDSVVHLKSRWNNCDRFEWRARDFPNNHPFYL